MDFTTLIEKALEARKFAYTPYSKFMVGACLLLDDDTFINGCNVENASYGATNCAERTAIFKAVSEGHTAFKAIAVVGGDENDDPNHLNTFAYPCGICRQVMREFCNPDTFIVIVAKSTTDYEQYLLRDLLPNSFGPEFLL